MMNTVVSFHGHNKREGRGGGPTLPNRALDLGMMCFMESIISVLSADK